MRSNWNTGRLVGALPAILFVLCLTAVASAMPVEGMTDTVQNHVEQALQAHGLQNISVVVQDGQVTLAGLVPTLADKLRAEKLATKTRGVTGVTNRLTLEDRGVTDAQVVKDVEKSIHTYVYYNAFEWVSGTVNNGVVTLTGWSQQPWYSADYEKRIQEIPGVQQVINRISVLPVSQYDQRLRLRVARLIYSHPVLSKYGVGLYPSIHIIVDRGKVILEGVVDSASAQSVAGMLANRSMAFKVTNDLQVHSES